MIRNQPFQSRLCLNGSSPNPALQTWAHDVPPQMPWSAPVDPSIMRFTAQPTQYVYPNILMQPVYQQPPATFQSAYPQTVPLVQPTYSPIQVSQPTVINEPVGNPSAQKWKFPPFGNTSSSVKRRNSSSDEEEEGIDQPPSKVHAGADRVAAKLSNLDIDSDNDGPIVVELSEDSEDCVEEDMNENSHGVVHLSDEVKTVFASDHLDTLNQLLKDEREKNKKALMLWTPPIDVLRPVIEDSDDDEDLTPGITITEIFDDDDRMEI